MKRLLTLLSALVMGAVSCAKDRVCDCTQKHSKNDTLITTSKTTIVKSTKSQAKANCVSTKWVSNDTIFTKDCTLN